MWRLWVTILFLIGSENLLADEGVIVFNMPEGGYPPFMINKKNTQPSGIIYDVLQLILSKQGYVIKTISVPKKRELEFFKTGKLDAHAMIRELVDEPSQYVFSDPVLKIRNVLFTTVGNPITFNKIDDLIGKRAITHLGYKYPTLERYFEEGLIERHDTVNESAMLGMTLLKRADFAIMNDYVGAWIIKQKQWSGKFQVSKNDISTYDYRIMFSKKWNSLVLKFNKELALLKENGSLEKIIEKYAVCNDNNICSAKFGNN